MNTILVIDDSDMVRALIQEALELFGYRVLTADSGEAALTIYKEHNHEIDGVLLDLTMPGMNGLQTFEALQQIKAGAKVLLTSGFHLDGLHLQNGNRVFSGFLKKPFKLQELQDAVSRMLRSSVSGAV